MSKYTFQRKGIIGCISVFADNIKRIRKGQIRSGYMRVQKSLYGPLWIFGIRKYKGMDKYLALNNADRLSQR